MTLTPAAPPEPNRSAHLRGRRIAALVRCHRTYCPKALDLAHALREAGFHEVLFVADETHGRVEAGDFEKVPHTLASLADLGLRIGDPGRALWYFGDYAFYGSVLGRSSSDFWLMVEYDVGLRDRRSDWWRKLRLALEEPRFADLDMVGPYLHQYRRTNFLHGYDIAWKILFAITGLSARAGDTLFHDRIREVATGAVDPRGTHCELFVPSQLRMAGGFRCADLNELVPGMVARPAFSTAMICPFGHEDLVAGNCGLIHRVVDMEEYVEKGPRVFARAGNLELLRKQLDALLGRGLSASVAAEMLARAANEAHRLERRASTSS